MSSPSINYSSVSSTLQALRGQTLPDIQAETVFQKFGRDIKESPALFEAVKKALQANPKKEFTLEKFTALELSLKVTAVEQVMLGKAKEIVEEPAALLAATPVSIGDIRYFPTCWSSKRMTELMNWRNPDVQAKPTALRSILNITKRVLTEVALPFLAVTAAVETVATQAIILGAKALQPISKRPIDYINSTRVPSINISARFTTVWTASTLWDNIMTKSLPFGELTAREELFKGYFKV